VITSPLAPVQPTEARESQTSRAGFVDRQPQIRDTTAALDRYLRAFEAGSMPDAVCAPRVEELAAQRQELTDYRDEVTASLSRTPALPPRQHLESVAAPCSRP
jgi:hypothetical protein